VSASWTPEQVLRLAPDGASAKAGRTQSAPARWSGLGAGDRALWGLCQGSGAKPYEAVVDLAEPAFRCSCPSRKFPCKHALGLMLLWAQDPAALPAGTPPDWAAEWLAGRAERTARRAARAPTRAAADPEKARADAARRVARREQRVADGIAELRLWLDDLVRQGFAHAEQNGHRDFLRMAARLVDAQAPGLARRVRDMAATLGFRESWPERLLEQAALLRLLADAYDRRDALPAGLCADVRALVGWTINHEELLRVGERVEDDWHCVGQVLEEDERLNTRRTWLHGERTGRTAMLLDFAHPSQPLPGAPAPGETMRGDLVFHPAAVPQRAAIADARETRPDGRPLAALDTVAALYDARARALAANPWAERHGVAVAAIPVEHDGRWYVADGSRAAIALHRGAEHAGRTLAALAGGRPLATFGEWGPYGLRPLSAWHDGRLVAL
jgi:hypothetical protein